MFHFACVHMLQELIELPLDAGRPAIGGTFPHSRGLDPNVRPNARCSGADLRTGLNCTLLIAGYAWHDSYQVDTALLAGEAYVDSAVVDLAIKVMTRRKRPSDVPPGAPFDDTFFSRITGESHFPSDVFPGAALGYTITRYQVLRPSLNLCHSSLLLQ